MPATLSAAIAILSISLISFVGALLLFVYKKLKSITPALVSLAIGSLLASSFLHLIPEATADLNDYQFALTILASIFAFFLLEQLLCFHHCHHSSSLHPTVVVNLLGDAFHNFIDGLVLAAVFSTQPLLGWSTAVAILFHEIPQEIGDFGIIVHHGLKPIKALQLNFLTALTSFLGLFAFLLIRQNFASVTPYLLAVTAGNFIYLSLSDLLPSLHSHIKISQFAFIILGVFIIFLIK